jgi:2-iminobutanoate/2-iminopropanoate deaminase
MAKQSIAHRLATMLDSPPMDLEFLMVPGAPPPPPTAPYSHAVRAGEFLFVTGQIPSDPKTGDRLVPGGIVEQTHQVMKNLQTVLAGAGTSLDRVVFARVYLVNFQDYAAMNGVYVTYFKPGRLPGRTCVGVTGLAVGALVEIDLIVKP